MANQKYNRKETVSSGYSVISMKNKIKKAQQARSEGNYSDAQKILDDIDFVFQNESIDLNKATPVLNSKMVTHDSRIESEKLTNLLKSLHNENFFELVPKSGFSANSAIEKAIDFNDKIVYNQQGVNTFASYTDVMESYKRLQEMKKSGAGNYLYLFDTETIGGTNKSNVWNPLGITEFAMQKIDLGSNEVVKTNVVLGTADTIENKKMMERILNALGSTLGDPELDGVTKMTNDPSIILNNEELRVTAYRYAIYGDDASEFIDSGKGYMQAKKLASSDINDWLDPEKIKRGYLKNVAAYKNSPTTKYGFNEAQKVFIDSMHEMYQAAQNGTGMIGGQNIVPFDIKVVNTELARIRKSLQDSINSGGVNGIAPSAAQEGLNYINSRFGGGLGFTAPSKQIFDTLPMINFIRDKFGIDVLYNNNQEAIMAAGRGTAKQEHIGAVWFPELFASGEAHMADFDVDVQRNFFLSPIEQLNGKTFIEHFMEQESGGGLAGLNLQAKTIKAGGEQQLLYAKKGTRDRTFGGKAALDHTLNRRTGEVFTSSNYEIMGPNAMPSFAGDINMGTNINKGQFYYVDSIKKINATDLPKELGDTLPELSGPEMFQVRMRMAVSDKHKGKGLEDLEYVLHFGSEYELSGWFSSSFDMPLVKDDNGKWVLNGDNAADILEQVKIKDGIIERNPDFYLKEPETMLEQVLENTNEKVLADRALRDLNDPNKLYGRVEKQLNLRKTLTKNGLDDITEEEIASLLSGTPIPRMKDMSTKNSQNLIKQIRDIAGFTPFGTNETKLYSNSANKLVTAWNFVGANDEFYMKVLDDLNSYSEANHLTKNQRKIMFSQVVENLKTQVANELYDSPEQIRNIVHNVKDYEGSIAEVSKIFDIELPDNFIIEQAKKKQIETGINLTANKNILSVRLGDNSSSFQLEDKLVKLKFGDRDLRMNPDKYKRMAMYDFVNHLSTLDDFKENKYIAEAIKHMSADTEEFSTNTVARYVLNAMEEIKQVDPAKGIIKDISVRSLLEGTPEYNARLNNISNAMINRAIKEAPVPLDLIGVKNKDAAIKKHIQTHVLKNYLPTRSEFENTLAGLNEKQVWQKTLLYNTLEKQITDSLVDITGSLSSIPNSELSIMPDGRFIFKQGQEAVTIDSIPKIKLDGDVLYGQVGNSPVQVHLDIGVNKNGGSYITTNLGDSYSANKKVTKAIRRKVKDGTFRTEDVLNITSHLSEKFRQDSRYEFKSGDYYSNYMVGTGDLDTILPRMFSEDGDLRDIGNKINLTDKERSILEDTFRNADKEIKPGELDPVINQYLSAYRVEIMQTLAETTGNADVQQLASGLTIGTKGKGKLQKGKLMGSDMRFATGFSNAFDNLGRPVVDGSGNVKFVRSDQVKEATKKMQGMFYEGALFESVDTDKLNRIAADGVGEITTGWTSRTAYVGQQGIKAIIETNHDKVLANNTIANLSADKKQNIYDMLYAYVNTFEQQKVLDAKAFDSVTGGVMSANTIKLSSAKDFINIPQEEKLLHADKYQRLMNLMGDIEITPEGVINYKSSVGEIVKRGETIIPFAQFGGSSSNWTTKMDRSLLKFQVSNKKGISLTDTEISKILQQNKHLFTDIDPTDKAAMLNAFVKSLDDYNINFAVEDVNRMTLPKILANDSEKSMNHLLYAKTGSIDERVAKVFKTYSDDTAELLQGTVLTPQALNAYFKDTQRRRIVAKQAGFKSWGQFTKAWEKEMYTMRDIVFGKGGLFEGFTDIANDNLLGHDNKGTMLIGSLNEAIAMLGKYSNNGIESEVSRRKGLDEFVKLYNRTTDDGSSPFKFFVDGSGKGIDLEVVDGHLRFKSGRSLNMSLKDSDSVDYKKLESLVKDIDSFIKGKGASSEDRLVHKVKNVNGVLHSIGDNEEGEEIIGRMLYSKKGNKDIIVGSVGSTHHKIVLDPETQSSMPQEYFDTKMDYMKLKGDKINLENEIKRVEKTIDPEDLNEVLKLQDKKNKLANMNNTLSSMDEYLKNMEGTGHAFRVGDQEEKIIKNYFINKNSFSAIDDRIAQGTLSKEALNASNVLRGLDRSAYTSTNGDIVYKGLIDELHAQKYYNPYVDTKKLTKKMVEQEEYSHLKDIYDDVIGTGRANKLGVETAQEIYDIKMASLADEYNNVNRNKKKLLDAGFEIMTPKDYIDQFGDPNIPNYTAAIKKNVLLELDMGNGAGPEYIAVPGMGSVLDNAEIKQDWHKHAGRLSRIYEEEFVPMHGSPVGREAVLNRMEDIKNDLRKSTASYLEKGSEAHNRARQEVHAAVDRVKIISTMGDVDNPLMKQAMMDGRSLSDWIKDGVYHDYTFDSLESFEKRGYFKKDFLDKMNMTREDMIEHLRTQGTVMLDDRYPNIRERSITPIRHYLAVDDQGMSFLSNNATMMAPWTALAMNADSDGDSVSRFLVKHKGIDHAQYSVARSRALGVIGTADDLDDLTREKAIRSKTIEIMQNDFGIKRYADEAYDTFFKREANMTITAMTSNQKWYNDVLKTWEGDNKKVVKAMTLKYGDGFSGAEVVGGKSIFGHTKFTALTETPSWKQIQHNMDQVNQMINVVQQNAHLLTDETREYASDVIYNSADILIHNDEAAALDKALVAYKELSDTAGSKVSSKGFAAMQEAAVERARISKYHIEGMKKLGVTATGNVNSTLYGISQAIKSQYGDINNPLYDEVMRSITSEMSYLLEESPISGKKYEIKAGDARLIEFGNIFRSVEAQGRTEENVANMQNYFKKYMNHGDIADAYDMTMERAGIPIAERLTDATKKVDYMVEQYTDYIGEALDQKTSLYKQVVGYRNFGRRSVQPGVMHKLAGQLETGSSNMADAITDTTSKNTKSAKLSQKLIRETAEANAENIAKNFSPPEIHVDEKKIADAMGAASNKVAKAIMDNSGGLKKSLGLGVVGLAAGLIASGYASGNPLNNPDPATITQKGYEGVQAAPEMMFSSGQGFAPNNTGGYIINIKGDTKKGNRQLKKALRQATKNTVGSTGVTMNVKTSKSQGTYSENDIENILNNYF